ncbi:MAG: hypothetical protein AB1610_08985 [Nitrospirota bacterium]
MGKKNWSEYWTRALIFMESPTVKEEELEKVRETGIVAFTKPYFDAIQLLNHAILSYATATKELFGGRPIELFSDIEFFNSLEWGITFVVNEGDSFEQENIDQIFALQPEKAIIMGPQYHGTLEDLPPEKVSLIQGYVDKVKENIFYEFAQRAKNRMVDRDFPGGLLMIVVALEGVHAAFLRKHLSRLLPMDERRSSKLISDFLREQGFYVLVQLTPHLFLPAAHRPSPDVLEECLNGINMRNAIMHALTDSKGRYKIKGYKNIEVNNAYSAVFKVYECFVKAYEDA